MAKCYNCGCEIDSEDKTRLCDKCKRIMLPFVKFMDASTSSAVRRLVSNEKNLKNAGVTDDGMEYLLRICEIHDKKKLREREEREAKKASDSVVQEETVEEKDYSEVELPMDAPLNLIKEQYGTFLPAAEIVLIAAGAALLIWSVYRCIADKTFDVSTLAASFASLAGAYGVDVLRKIKSDIDEIKKRFR